MCDRKPMILVFAGPNGSGKSTFKDYFECIGTYTNADDVTAAYQDGSKLVATLKDDSDNVIAGEKVKIVLNHVVKYIKTDDNGQVALSLNNLDVGTYKATLTFVATDIYNKATTTAKVTITEPI